MGIDTSVASIFVNRLQFLPHEDFDRYPRTFEADCEQLESVGCDVLFAPDEAELYPELQRFKVHPDPKIADILEGHFRPGFFVGVSTVVMKLFQCVQPRVAVFGKKDYQQLLVIRKLIEQFAMPIELIAAETQRASDGLALSSRNRYLTAQEREQALGLRQALEFAIAQFTQKYDCSLNELDSIERQAMHRLAQQGWQPDYIALRLRETLERPSSHTPPGRWVALGAAKLAQTRLIDNLEF